MGSPVKDAPTTEYAHYMYTKDAQRIEICTKFAP